MRRSWIVPSSSIIWFISFSDASPILSQISFICSSISNRKENALFNTSRIVMPFSRTACWSKYPARTFLDHSTLPSSGCNLPVMMFMKVDFPSPLAPTSPICSPFNNLKETSWKIARSPNPWLKCSTFKILINITYSLFVDIPILHEKSKRRNQISWQFWFEISKFIGGYAIS